MTNDDQNIDKEIKEVLTGIGRSFHAESEDKHGAKFDELFANAIVSPSQFYTIYSYPAREEKDTLVRLMVERIKPYYSHQKFLVNFLYTDYEFVKRFLSAQISNYEGGACSVDKTHGVIKLVMASIVNELYPMPKEAQWYLPEIESITLWCDLVQSLCYFSHGQTEKYVKAQAALEDFYANLKGV